MNCALLKLLPKSDKGLRDMNAVRPIALMENISKVFEQIIIGRIFKVIVDNEILTKSWTYHSMGPFLKQEQPPH